jgi:phosphohistidine phosphatase
VRVQIFLMRHGAAEDRSPSGLDVDRALTQAGSEAVLRVAAALRAARPKGLGRIIASPLVRAQQTAELMRSVLAPGVELETDESLAPDESAYDLAVRSAACSVDTLLVGHQPNIEMVARALAIPAARPSPRPPWVNAPAPAIRMPAQFRTATLVGFEVEGRPPPFALAWAIDPADLSTG